MMHLVQSERVMGGHASGARALQAKRTDDEMIYAVVENTQSSVKKIYSLKTWVDP